MDQRTEMAVVTTVVAAVQSVAAFYEEFMLSPSSQSDDEASSHEEQPQKPKKRKKTSAPESQIHESFVEFTVPTRLTHTEFEYSYRLSVNAFEWLLNKISHQLQSKRITIGRPSTCPKTQLLSVLWLFATAESFRSVACRFNLSKGTLHACFMRVLYALNSLSPTVIAWPNAEKRKLSSEKFKQLGGFEGVVGAVDVTYIRTKASSENTQEDINRKCFPGITLQAICDENLQFIDCFAGYPRSVSDSKIFSESDFYKRIVGNPTSYFSQNEYIIGDEAYETKPFCVPPYREEPNFTEWQQKFNHLHAKTWQVIESAFSLFFGRFRRFQNLDMSRKDLIPASVIAACVLHNVCLTHSSDTLHAQFEAEGAVYLQQRQVEDQGREPSVAPVTQTNDEGGAFRDQLALEMGLLNEDYR